jgi:hypothetical protein
MKTETSAKAETLLITNRLEVATCIVNGDTINSRNEENNNTQSRLTIETFENSS